LPQDCSDLEVCVGLYSEYAKEENLIGYAQYLEDYPTITNTTNSKQCGDAREYFGYDPDFLNDAHICDDIFQLRYTEDFDFLNEFFNQGTNTNPTICDGNAPSCLLTEPTPEDEFSSPILKGKQWRSSNFAIGQISQLLYDGYDYAGNLECPATPIVTVACTALKNLVVTVFFFSAVVTRLVRFK
jgi:hypothetical protein